MPSAFITQISSSTNSFDALYLSGVAVTTVGFGDVVAQTDPLRLVTIMEAVSGLALATAALGYLPVICIMTGDRRTAALFVNDICADEPTRATDVVVNDGLSTIDGLRRD